MYNSSRQPQAQRLLHRCILRGRCAKLRPPLALFSFDLSRFVQYDLDHSRLLASRRHSFRTPFARRTTLRPHPHPLLSLPSPPFPASQPLTLPHTAMFLAAYSAALALATPALATIYTTSPVGSTQAYGGQALTITWDDNGESPTLPEIGPCSIDLCIGSDNDQRCVQNLGERVDVSKATTLTATINPNAGENGKYYFIRYRSLNLVDPNSAPNGQEATWPYQQYSARFFLNSMTGNFDEQTKAIATASTGDSIGASSTGPGASAGSAGSTGSPGSAAATGSQAGAVGAAVDPSASTGASGAGAALTPSASPSASGARTPAAGSSVSAGSSASASASGSAKPSETPNSGVAQLASSGLFAVAACIAAYIAV